PRSHLSTLIPYTTLFRSSWNALASARVDRDRSLRGGECPGACRGALPGGVGDPAVLVEGEPNALPLGVAVLVGRPHLVLRDTLVRLHGDPAYVETGDSLVFLAQPGGSTVPQLAGGVLHCSFGILGNSVQVIRAHLGHVLRLAVGHGALWHD